MKPLVNYKKTAPFLINYTCHHICIVSEVSRSSFDAIMKLLGIITAISQRNEVFTLQFLYEEYVN